MSVNFTAKGPRKVEMSNGGARKALRLLGRRSPHLQGSMSTIAMKTRLDAITNEIVETVAEPSRKLPEGVGDCLSFEGVRASLEELRELVLAALQSRTEEIRWE